MLNICIKTKKEHTNLFFETPNKLACFYYFYFNGYFIGY